MTTFFNKYNIAWLESGIILVVAVSLWLYLTHLFYSKVHSGLNTRASKREAMTKGQHFSFEVSRIIIAIISIVSLLHVNGVNITATIRGLGIAGAVIGLALQDTIKDTFRGLGLMSDRFYKVGDVILYEGMHAEVISMTLRSTKLRDIDSGSIITVFNGKFDSAVKVSGVQFLDIPLSYKEDYKKVHQVMQEIVDRISKIDGIIFCTYKGTQNFEESAVIYRIKITTRQYDKFDLRRAALACVQEGLDEAGIEIPYKQLDVHLEK